MKNDNTFTLLKKLDALLQERVLSDDGLFCQVLQQRQETSLGVEPSVDAQFLVERLQAADNSRNSEFIVALGAVQRSIKRKNYLTSFSFLVSI